MVTFLELLKWCSGTYKICKKVTNTLINNISGGTSKFGWNSLEGKGFLWEIHQREFTGGNLPEGFSKQLAVTKATSTFYRPLFSQKSSTIDAPLQYVLMLLPVNYYLVLTVTFFIAFSFLVFFCYPFFLIYFSLIFALIFTCQHCVCFVILATALFS